MVVIEGDNILRGYSEVRPVALNFYLMYEKGLAVLINAVADQIDSVTFDLTTLADSAGIDNVGAAGASTTFNIYTHAFDIDETTATWKAPGSGDGTASGTLGTFLTSTRFYVEAPPYHPMTAPPTTSLKSKFLAIIAYSSNHDAYASN